MNAKLIVVPMPENANPYGNVFGGWIMGQMDIAGAIAAKEITKNQVVTKAVENMEFVKPIFVGDVVSFFADIIKIGETSIKVSIKVFAIRSNCDKESENVANAIITYVNIGKNGEKLKIIK